MLKTSYKRYFYKAQNRTKYCFGTVDFKNVPNLADIIHHVAKKNNWEEEDIIIDSFSYVGKVRYGRKEKR